MDHQQLVDELLQIMNAVAAKLGISQRHGVSIAAAHISKAAERPDVLKRTVRRSWQGAMCAPEAISALTTTQKARADEILTALEAP